MAATSDDCVQVISVANPAAPAATFAYADMREGFSYLDNPYAVKAVYVHPKTYVMVNSISDNAVVLIDASDPADCREASSMAFSAAKSSGG